MQKHARSECVFRLSSGIYVIHYALTACGLRQLLITPLLRAGFGNY
jgi:hypothetical protein